MNNEILLEKLRAMEEEAFSYVYKKCFSQISKLASLNSDKAYDLHDYFHETLVELIVNVLAKPNFKLTGSICSLLSTIARNKVVQRYRDKNPNDTAETIFMQALMEDSQIELDNKETLKENIELMKIVLGELKADCREVLDEFYTEDLSHKEIAEKRNISVNYSRGRKKRCLDYLKRDFFKKKGK